MADYNGLLGKIKVLLQLDNKDLKDGATEAKEELNDVAEHANSVGGKITSAFKKIGPMVAGFFAVDKLIDFTKQIVKTRAEIQSLGSSFKVLLGSQSKANDLMKQMRDYASATPMQLNDLASAAQTMLGFGVELEKVMPMLKALGDISGGNSQKFQSLALAFSQMSSTGKLMGQDLLQMINAGFNPLKTISDKTGISIATLKEQMSKGAISAEMVTKAFIDATSAGGQFNGMLEEQSKTVAGSISKLQSAWTDMLNEIGTSTEGVFTSITKYITDAVNEIVKAISKANKFGLDTPSDLKYMNEVYDKTLEYVKTTYGDDFDKGLDYLKETIKSYEAEVEKLKNNRLYQSDLAMKVGNPKQLEMFKNRIIALNRALADYGLAQKQAELDKNLGNTKPDMPIIENATAEVDVTVKEVNIDEGVADKMNKTIAEALSYSAGDLSVDYSELDNLIPDYDLGSIKDLENQLRLLADAMNNLNLSTEQGQISAGKLGVAYQALQGQLEEAKLKVEELQQSSEQNKQVTIDLSDSLQNTATNAIVAFSKSIGEALGSGDIDNAMNKILEPLAQGAQSMGAIMVAMGTSLLVLETSMNPYAMIAAGAALVALGAAMSAVISNMQKDVGGSGSSYNTYTGGYSNAGVTSSNYSVANTGQSNNVVVLTTKVSGSDLLLVQERESNRRSR